jgi:hypothetical protein
LLLLLLFRTGCLDRGHGEQMAIVASCKSRRMVARKTIHADERV